MVHLAIPYILFFNVSQSRSLMTTYVIASCIGLKVFNIITQQWLKYNKVEVVAS
jgi:hypothetical protein